MVEEGYHRRDDGQDSTSLGERDRTWARIVQGPPRGPSWTSHKITNDEIDQLQSYCSKILELPETLIDDSLRYWEGLAVVIKSFGMQDSGIVGIQGG